MATEPTWEELLGSNNWDGLLDPLNVSLRNLVIHCGELCQAVMDAFNNDQGSKYLGSSRYGKKSFFEKVMLESASDYEVRAFLYAPTKLVSPSTVVKKSKSDDSWDRDSNMIGFIAVTTDEVSQALGRREIYIVWRGTVTSNEWINDLDIGDIRVAAVVSASPHVGDQVFVNRVTMYPNLKVFRTLNTHDIVPGYPQTLFLEYKAVGVELKVDKHKSPYLKIAEEHNLEALLHVVSGWNGDNKPFEWNGKRSLALVNRDADVLKDEYLIPVKWWVEHNRGMIRVEKEKWVLGQDEPEPEFGNQG